ncbi:DsbA family protein [Epibacterium ulvae]|uniref:DsbA family protein n=1 Tax=Epibacterium ulvae TaxID=1156985 RepID=UPI001BFC7B16|nr:DsbA family protein [Epibacterium ulvae]MBT8156136.1 DsbA family protein [Epibacterium ulvae]
MTSLAQTVKRFSASAVTALALTLPAAALDLGAMTADEQAEFGEQVRAFLLENPQVILEAIDILEQRNAVAEAERDKSLVQHNLAALVDDGYSWVGGNPEGDITVVEFMDYRCGFCRRAKPEVEQLLAQDGNIRLIIKELPILGESSVVASRFAIAAKHIEGPEAYKTIHDALMEMPGEPNEIILSRLSDSFGFDTAKILEGMNTEAVTSELRRTRQLASNMSIGGTPTFILGDELVRGYLPFDQMKTMIQEQRAENG